MVEHRAEHSVERKLRMQKHRRFEEEVYLAETTGRRVAVGNILDSREKLIHIGSGIRCAEYNLV